MYDLPSEDPEEPGLPDEFHDYQPALLSETFKLRDYTSEETFSAADLNLYYDPEHNWYKRPDWFGVLGKPAGCDSHELRLSYVVWQEEISPFIAVELFSPGTANEDFGRTVDERGRPPTKWSVYEKILQIPYYVIYDRYDDLLSGFRLVNGQYQPMEIGADRKIWLPEANAGLGIWQGKYKRFTREWLRWYDRDGWIPTIQEDSERQLALLQQQASLLRQQALSERRAKEQAQQEATKEKARNARLQAKLKALGIDSDADLDTDLDLDANSIE